jgi:diguanylate cyclase (GGDEF)-like protein
MNTASTKGLRLARRAWELLHLDSARSIDLAEQALAIAAAGHDIGAQGWARLAIGFHLLYFGTPAQARVALEAAAACFGQTDDRAGAILAGAGLARCLWREGRFAESLDQVLPLRDEGLLVLRHEQRGVLLNTIAGCYSAQGHSEQAFAYMYQALRDSTPTHGHGFDAVLYCNLAHELLQLGDYHEALRYLDQGVARCRRLKNPRLLSVLLINRVICLTELDRAQEALLDVLQVRNLPADASGRGTMATHFETLAVAALRAGELAVGSELVALAWATPRAAIPDEQVELAIAAALLAGQRGEWSAALEQLDRVLPLVGADDDDAAEGLSLRVRCLYFLTRSELQEQLGDSRRALATLRIWQQLHVARAHLASRARYQAAALQTELLRLKQTLDEHDARRRATERARTELEAINQQLSRKIDEVQSLQAALKEQVTRDALTGLFNRRYLNDTLPASFALARRDRQPLAVAIIDLDHFKATNDRYGHAVGDLLLERFGQMLAANCRESDVACRYGGEEFCLLMPHTDANTARRKVDGLLERWSGQSLALEGETLSGLTFSAGVADTRQVPVSAQALLKCADDQLLLAKQTGRSRVLVLGAPAGRAA